MEAGHPLETLKLRLKGKSNRWELHHFRRAYRVPLTYSEDKLKINWRELTITDGPERLKHRNAFITDWEVNAEPGAGLLAAGRARWKFENEHNNVLKNRGYHLEHNFGCGKLHLASLLLTMNLLAFDLHTFLELGDESCRLIGAQHGARRTFYQHFQAVTTYWHFESWAGLMDFMMRGWKSVFTPWKELKAARMRGRTPRRREGRACTDLAPPFAFPGQNHRPTPLSTNRAVRNGGRGRFCALIAISS